jgi:hypothetical protein
MNDPVLRLDQAEVREVMAAWEHHAEAGARADRAGETSKWKAAEEYPKAQEAGVSLRQIAEKAGYSHTHIRRMIAMLETRVSTPDVTFTEAYSRTKWWRHVPAELGEAPTMLTEALGPRPDGLAAELWDWAAPYVEAIQTAEEASAQIHREIVQEIATCEDLETLVVWIRAGHPRLGEMTDLNNDIEWLRKELKDGAEIWQELAESRIEELRSA